MERLADWLKRELKLDTVRIVERQTHGHLLIGNVQGRDIDLLVISSGHVWVKHPAARSWSTTGIYVPERVGF
ncbi:hypothetical protein ACL02P_00415 [Paenibacillus sp. MB22_1]|uniref:hypothetical protein n=1 Tax=Paenibacillus TaxID=44249 RepID=UPI0039A143A9